MDKILDFLNKSYKKLNSDYEKEKSEKFPFGFIYQKIAPWRLKQDLQYPLNVLDFILKNIDDMSDFLKSILSPSIIREIKSLANLYAELQSEEDIDLDFNKQKRTEFIPAESAFLKAKKMKNEDKNKVRPNSVFHKLFYEIASDPRFLARHLIENLRSPIESVLSPNFKGKFLKDLREKDLNLYLKYISIFEKENINERDRFNIAIKNIEEEVGEDVVKRVRDGLKDYYLDKEEERPLNNMKRLYRLIFGVLPKEKITIEEISKEIAQKLIQGPIVTSFKLSPFFSEELIGKGKELITKDFIDALNDIKKIGELDYNDKGNIHMPIASLQRLLGLGLIDKEQVKKILKILVGKNGAKKVIEETKKIGLENLFYEIEGFVGENIEEFDFSKRKVEDEASLSALLEKANNSANIKKSKKYVSYFIFSLFNLLKQESLVDIFKKTVDGWNTLSQGDVKAFYLDLVKRYFNYLVIPNLDKYIQDISHRINEFDINHINFLKLIIDFSKIQINSPETAAFVYLISQKDPSINKNNLVEYFSKVFSSGNYQSVYDKIKKFWDIISTAKIDLPEKEKVDMLLESLINKKMPQTPSVFDFKKIFQL